MSYLSCYSLISQKDITKNDFIEICKSLTNEIGNACTFKPENISEGGLVYQFNDSCPKEWYKSVRLRITTSQYTKTTKDPNGTLHRKGDTACDDWPCVLTTVMDDWANNNEIILPIDRNIGVFLKSFNGAPLFTIDELKIFEKCFNAVGFKRVGKYPSKRSLTACAFP